MTSGSWTTAKVRLAVVAAIVAMIAVAALSYRATTLSEQSDRWVRHTHSILDNIQDLTASMAFIESDTRGFVLSGDDAFLASFDAAVASAARDQAAIHALISDNPAQQIRLRDLNLLVAEKIQFTKATVALRRSEGLVASAALVRDGSGLAIMGRLLATAGELRAEELRLLGLRDHEAVRLLTDAKRVLVLGTLLGLLITGLAGWSVDRDSVRRRRAETALREGEDTFRSMADYIPQMAWMADETGKAFWFNQRWFDYTGSVSVDGADPRSREMIHPDHAQRVNAKLSHAFATGNAWDDSFPLRARDGSYRWFLVRGAPIRNREGTVIRWFGTSTDISERMAIEDALFAEKERAQVTLNSIGDAVVCTDVLSNITYLNLVAERMSGWSSQDALGRPMEEIIRIENAATREPIPNPMQRAVVENQTGHLPANSILVRRDGVQTPIEDSVAPIHNRQGDSIGAVMVFRDVRAAMALALQMAHSAQHDFLTGLPNRMLLNDRIKQAIALAERHGNKIAVLFLDLDGFKQINDSLGHSTGDKLLQSIATRLVGCVRAADTVSRQGGDEFVVLLSEIEEPGGAAVSAQKLLLAVAAAHAIDLHDLYVTTSIGVSVFPEDGLDAEALIKHADTAMYQAKQEGRQTFRFFRPASDAAGKCVPSRASRDGRASRLAAEGAIIRSSTSEPA